MIVVKIEKKIWIVPTIFKYTRARLYMQCKCPKYIRSHPGSSVTVADIGGGVVTVNIKPSKLVDAAIVVLNVLDVVVFIVVNVSGLMEDSLNVMFFVVENVVWVVLMVLGFDVGGDFGAVGWGLLAGSAVVLK